MLPSLIIKKKVNNVILNCKKYSNVMLLIEKLIVNTEESLHIFCSYCIAVAGLQFAKEEIWRKP